MYSCWWASVRACVCMKWMVIGHTMQTLLLDTQHFFFCLLVFFRCLSIVWSQTDIVKCLHNIYSFLWHFAVVLCGQNVKMDNWMACSSISCSGAFVSVWPVANWLITLSSSTLNWAAFLPLFLLHLSLVVSLSISFSNFAEKCCGSFSRSARAYTIVAVQQRSPSLSFNNN